MKKRMTEKMSQPSKVKSCTSQFASTPTNRKNNDFKVVLDLLSKVLQKFVGEAPPQDAAVRSENIAQKSPTDDPNEVKSPVMDVGGSMRRSQKSKRKEEKEKKGDKLKIHTPYRPKDGYFHDPEISSQKGSMLSLPSDHSDRSYALSIFSVVSSTKMDSQNGAETVIPTGKSKRCHQKTND